MRQIDVHEVADDARFNRFHGQVLFWSALIIVFDGYDLAVAGVALPSIMKEMGVDPTNAGFMVSSALFGMMFGAIFLGTIADRIGRRWATAACVALFSVFTAAAGMTHDPITFSAMRFLAGLGIGGAMPIVVAQMTEYSPRRMRSTLVTLMFSGYSVGGILAAVLGKGLLLSHGWQSVFVAAGLPIVIIPLVLKLMPESMPFLVRKGRAPELEAIVARLKPGHRPEPGDRYTAASRGRAEGARIHHLFAEGRGLSTAMFWTAFFMCLFMVYALSSWLAKLMAGAGYSLGSALTFVLVLNAGAMAGAIGGGWLADKLHIKWVLVGMYVLAALSISLLGQPLPTAVLFAVVALAGASTIGTQIVTYAYVGQFYPAAVRATGIGWASGVGRSGAILAPIVIGMLVSLKLPLPQNFLAMAVPAIVATLAVLMIDHRRSASARQLVAVSGPIEDGALPAVEGA